MCQPTLYREAIMILLYTGILFSILFLILMSVCEIKSSVFPKIGFQDFDIEIDKITLRRYK